MSLPSGQSYTTRALTIRVVLVLGSAVLIASGTLYTLQPAQSQNAPQTASVVAPGMASPFTWPGIDNPSMVTAAKASLRDGEEIIGVSVAGKARAYLISAFAGPQHHVVNDVLFGQPVSVTHCDLENCTRVFTGAERDQPLGLACGGTLKGGLLLSAPGGIYVQETGASLNPALSGLPYERFPFVVTTWADWKRAHPETDVYVGDASVGNE